MSEKIVKTEQAQHALDNANKQKIKPKDEQKSIVKGYDIKKIIQVVIVK